MARIRTSRAGERAGGAGFTLLELLLVLAVLALLAGLVVAYIPSGSTRTEVVATAREVASGLRRARGAAIAGNAPVAFVLDVKKRSYRVGTEAPVRLARDIALTIDTARSEVSEVGDGAAGGIRFFPDGSASGGRISLRGAGERAAVAVVTVDWVTGRVDVAE
jgi:general secretion pathway protein H